MLLPIAMAGENDEPSRSRLLLLLPPLLAGFAKIVVDTTLAPLFVTGPWAVLRRTAAFVLGPRVVDPSVPFTTGVALVALFVHFALSLAYGSVLLILIERASRAAAVVIGIGFGIVLYVVNLHLLTPLFPWLADMRGLAEIVSHAIFGLVVALVYVATHPRPTLEDRAPAPARGEPMVL